MNGPHLHLVDKRSAEVIDLGRGSFVRELLGARAQEADEPPPVERYTLRAWADGLVIYDGWDRIATFHGMQWDLARKLLRLLQSEADAPTPPGAA